jgi:hypothetical protein
VTNAISGMTAIGGLLLDRSLPGRVIWSSWAGNSLLGYGSKLTCYIVHANSLLHWILLEETILIEQMHKFWALCLFFGVFVCVFVFICVLLRLYVCRFLSAGGRCGGMRWEGKEYSLQKQGAEPWTGGLKPFQKDQNDVTSTATRLQNTPKTDTAAQNIAPGQGNTMPGKDTEKPQRSAEKLPNVSSESHKWRTWIAQKVQSIHSLASPSAISPK